MGRFLKYIGGLVFLVLLICFVWGKSFPYSIFVDEYAMWEHADLAALGLASPGHFKTLILGDSRIKAAADVNKLDRAFSLSLGGATPIELYYLLENWLENRKTPERIILSISPYHLEGQDCFLDRTLRFDFLNLVQRWKVYKSIVDYNDSNYLKDRSWLALAYDMTLNHLFYFNELNGGNYIQNYKANKLRFNECVDRCGHVHFGLKTESNESNQEARRKGNFIESPVNDLYFRKLLDLICENEIETVFIQMPMSYSNKKRLPVAYYTGYLNYMAGFDSLCTSFELIPEILYLPDSMFGDGSHLNLQGTAYFTESYLSEKINLK